MPNLVSPKKMGVLVLFILIFFIKKICPFCNKVEVRHIGAGVGKIGDHSRSMEATVLVGLSRGGRWVSVQGGVLCF